MLKARGHSAHTVFVGEGDRKQRLAELARVTGVGGIVRFVGRVTDAELVAFYEAAFALVVPSPEESEGFGLVVLEALSTGCPVLASDAVPAAARFVGGSGAITFRARDVNDLADSMDLLASNPSHRARLADEARRLDLPSENRANLRRLADSILSLVDGEQAHTPPHEDVPMPRGLGGS